jgi:hypothetical protein
MVVAAYGPRAQAGHRLLVSVEPTAVANDDDCLVLKNFETGNYFLNNCEKIFFFQFEFVLAHQHPS